MPKYEFVAVDFDGTLCADTFPEVGEPKALVIDYVKRLAAEGSKIILYTSRENGTRPLLNEAVAFCKAQGIPLYAVFADLYIDDKAVNPLAIEAFGAAEIIAPEVQRVSAVLGQVVETLTPPLWRIAAYMRAVMRGTP